MRNPPTNYGPFSRWGAILLVLYSCPVSAGNTRSFFLGDEAAMTVGAGVEVSQDSGCLWYNPTGLGGLELNHLELSGSAYHGKFRRINRLFKADLPSGEHAADVNANTFRATPTTVVFIYNVSSKLTLGVAWYHTAEDYMEFTSDIQAPYGDGTDWYQTVAAYFRNSTYHLGPSVGLAIRIRATGVTH